jgi:hypothetical protein
MSSFNLSKQADPNKIFLTKFSELEGRFDPFYYKNDFIALNNKINNSPFELKKLCQISKKIVNGFDCRNYVDNGITYLKVSNIKMDNININNAVKIPYQEIHKDSTIKENDLLLTRKGTFGISAVVKAIHNNSIISSEIFKILLEDKKSSPYVSYWFNTKAGQAYFDRIKTGAIMGHITQEALRVFPIPIPPKNIQAEIVAKMDVAYQNKQNKEVKAKKLLNSIDTYLLGELEIELPKQTDNSLKARIFIKRLSDIARGRFDCEYYQSRYFNFEESLINTDKYVLLKDLLQMIESGSRPTGGVGQIKDGILSFGGTHVSKDGYIDTSKAKYIPTEYHQKNLTTATKINDLLFKPYSPMSDPIHPLKSHFAA